MKNMLTAGVELLGYYDGGYGGPSWDQDSFMQLRQDGYSNFKDLPKGWTQATDRQGKVGTL